MTRAKPQTYQHKETKETFKVERVNSNQVVVHYQTGPERVPQYELNSDFECIGPWEEDRNIESPDLL